MILRSFPDTKEAGTALVAVSAVASLLSVLLPVASGYIPPTNQREESPEKVIDAGTCVVYAHMAAAADATGRDARDKRQICSSSANPTADDRVSDGMELSDLIGTKLSTSAAPGGGGDIAVAVAASKPEW